LVAQGAAEGFVERDTIVGSGSRRGFVEIAWVQEQERKNEY